jgi:hypothetical protein
MALVLSLARCGSQFHSLMAEEEHVDSFSTFLAHELVEEDDNNASVSDHIEVKTTPNDDD